MRSLICLQGRRLNGTCRAGFLLHYGARMKYSSPNFNTEIEHDMSHSREDVSELLRSRRENGMHDYDVIVKPAP